MRRRKRKKRRFRGITSELTLRQILSWADAFHERAGEWPGRKAGPIREAPGEKWSNVDDALKLGLRGLPGGSSLAVLFLERRGVRHIQKLPPFNVNDILAWADAH